MAGGLAGCHGRRMSFFDRLPPAPQPEPEPPRPAWMKPEAVLAGVVAEELLLARSDDAAIAITGLQAYRTGFEFMLSAVLRREDRRGHMLQPGLPPWPGRDDEPLPAEFLRVGVQFADGGVATNLDRPPFPVTDAEPAGPLLLLAEGGGDGRRYDMRYWVWPLPPPGPVAFVCQWPAHGIGESRGEIDARLILDAAARAIDLWPEEHQASD
jgi:hypothetical protein